MTKEINKIILEELERELSKRNIGQDNINDTAKGHIINNVKKELKEEEADNGLFDDLDTDISKLFEDLNLEPLEVNLEPLEIDLEPFEDLELEPFDLDIKPVFTNNEDEKPLRERIRERIIRELDSEIAGEKPN